MKKLFSLLLLLSVTLSFMLTGCNLFNPDENKDNGDLEEVIDNGLGKHQFIFTPIKNGTEYELTGIGTHYGSYLEVPSTYNGLPVTSIGNDAFKRARDVIHIVIPDTVKVVKDCLLSIPSPSLSTVTFKGEIESIDTQTVSGQYIGMLRILFITSNSNTSVFDEIISDSSGPSSEAMRHMIYIADNDGNIKSLAGGTGFILENDFFFCTNYEKPQLMMYTGKNASITLPDNFRGEEYTLSHFRGAEEVIIPEGVTEIPDNAFDIRGNITMPSTVTRIGTDAFRMSNMIHITLPASLTEIGRNAIPSSVKVIYNNSSLNLQPRGNTSDVSAENAFVVVNKDGVQYATDGYKLTEDGFLVSEHEDSYTLIAYAGDEETVYLPQTIDGKPYVISYCDGIKDLVVPSYIEKIDDAAFQTSKTLRTVVIKSGVTEIGICAFQACQSLREVYIGKDVKLIGENAFFMTSYISSIIIDNAAADIDNYAFAGSGVAFIDMGKSIKKIGDHALSGIAATSINLPETVTSLGVGALRGNYYLEVISYGGTQEMWDALPKGDKWNDRTDKAKVVCKN